MLSRNRVEPLGSYNPLVASPVALLYGALAVVSATALLELSRTLAETYRGRWFAGNGRDFFHAGAVVVVTSGLYMNGLPLPLACVLGASICALPLLLIDRLPPSRRPRLGLLLALFAVAATPALAAPRPVTAGCNAVAARLFAH